MGRCKLMLFAISASMILAACHQGPISYLVAAPQPQDAAFSCALAKINELGYTVTNSNKASALIVATKDRTSGFAKFMRNEEDEDQLTISIFDASGSNGRKIRATAASTTKRSSLFSQQTSMTAPSKEGVAAANDVLLACGSGPVAKQTSMTYQAEVTAFGSE